MICTPESSSVADMLHLADLNRLGDALCNLQKCNAFEVCTLPQTTEAATVSSTNTMNTNKNDCLRDADAKVVYHI